MTTKKHPTGAGVTAPVPRSTTSPDGFDSRFINSALSACERRRNHRKRMPRHDALLRDAAECEKHTGEFTRALSRAIDHLDNEVKKR